MKQKTLGLLACTALLCACQPAQKQTTITSTLAGVESDTNSIQKFVESDKRICHSIYTARKVFCVIFKKL